VLFDFCGKYPALVFAVKVLRVAHVLAQKACFLSRAYNNVCSFRGEIDLYESEEGKNAKYKGCSKRKI
jgi:hypothetical protein